MTDPLIDSGQHDSTLQIILENCNSIDHGIISLAPGCLNIKYGPNGVGKSTIARALTLQCGEGDELNILTPFKHKSIGDGPRPSITGADCISSTMIFDEGYVAQFAFLRDEVVKNSFEIFVNTEDYRRGLETIETAFSSLKSTFESESEFLSATLSFRELRDAFNVTKSGSVAKNSKGMKALNMGGKLAAVPAPLSGYTDFLRGKNPAGWITWQSKGKEFLDQSENCPFCSIDSVDKTTARQVSEEFESAAVKNMGVLQEAIDKLGQYLNPLTLSKLEDLTSSLSGPTPEQQTFLASLRSDIETFLAKLQDLQALSFHALKDEVDLAATLRTLTIDLAFLPSLDSEATRSITELINQKLSDVASQINEIRRHIGEQKTRVAKTIRHHQKSINSFLTSAGYRYQVRIEPSEESYRMLLEHEDAPGHIESASTHLSYGEKNAFALVLFMHDVQHRAPDLVVLDDPVSSFDKTKKFAILNQLFRGPGSLRDTTTLLLTHDIEPAIDIVRTSSRFAGAKPIVHFLSNRGGRLAEKPISPTDIKTFSQVCDENIASASDNVIKCIYLRRKLEVHGTSGVAYELLSSVLHARETPTKKSLGGEHTPLSKSEIAASTAEVKECIADFDYDGLVADLKAHGSVVARFQRSKVGYEKVQLFRILLAVNPGAIEGDDVFIKFVNETYHIENEYVMQLNPATFDAVPEFVIERCSRLVDEFQASRPRT